MSTYNKLVLIVVVLGSFLKTIPLAAQSSIRDSSISIVMIHPSFGIQVPGGDMAKRFGANACIGVGVTLKHKSNWMFSADGGFIFGSDIKEPGLYSGIATPEGLLIGSTGFYGDINVFERGYYVALSIGRLFPVKRPNPNCGFYVQAGMGFMEHKIKFVDKKKTVPAVHGDYAKGYDHLTNGLMIREFAGYVYNGNRRLINFYGGIEMIQGFTQGRRNYDFDTQLPDNEKRLDLLFGIRVGWVIPLYNQAPDKYYIY